MKDSRFKNRFDVQVVLNDCAFGVRNRTDKDMTVDDVLVSLEEFCRRVRQSLAPPQSAPAVREDVEATTE